VNRLTEDLLLFMVGLAVAVVTFEGTYTHYVKPSLFPWLIAGAVVVVGLALTALARDASRWMQNASHYAPLDTVHDEHRHSASIAWFLVVPVAVLVFVPAPPLGAPAAAQQSDTVSAWHRHAFGALPAGRAPDVDLTEVLLRATNDTAGSLQGRLITVVGFTVKKGDQIDLGRFYIICCAADARLRRVTLQGPAAAVAAGYPDDTWLSVEGRVVAPDSPTKNPLLVASSAVPVDEPADPYDYPS
jgi:uncharacterized repeat protein (TIGR03943 family)